MMPIYFQGYTPNKSGKVDAKSQRDRQRMQRKPYQKREDSPLASGLPLLGVCVGFFGFKSILLLKTKV